MNETDEQYVHLANCIDSLNTAWRILKRIKHEQGNPLASFAFQFALIEYSKSYKGSNSAHSNRKGRPLQKYKLGVDFVPKEYLTLHTRIISARDKILAHLDLNVIDAKVYVQNTERGKIFLRSQNIIDGTEEMKNIDDIIHLIEETLDALQNEARRLGDNLPANI